jgi:hypothetical protein
MFYIYPNSMLNLVKKFIDNNLAEEAPIDQRSSVFQVYPICDQDKILLKLKFAL